ncbi:hypothetical protein SAMN05216360_104152 [Methylobacterium phyllostachyos]|uniref:Uncharacterized protein n=1 Tax=Methylobacterium phyllostachyos TaxID=582672 RepID=A0A1G9WWC3_9HYPH|nr:hypothetical protein SAMN05216360_104152 [Methylobacterium phyllostachyos]
MIGGIERQAAAVRLGLIARKHTEAETVHRARWTAEAEWLGADRLSAEATQALCERLLGLVYLGPVGLLELCRRLAATRNARQESEMEDYEGGRRSSACACR